jgi:phosphosulfolactate synthase
MNFPLTQMPDRHVKPRTDGLTMVMDKGLSIEEVKNFMSVAYPHVDVVKLGFGTSFVTPDLRKKIETYKTYDIPIYFGGTLFEAFLIRNQIDDYIAVLKDYGIDWIEVSDGSITIPHAEKCGYIEKLTRHGLVLSEVGSKDATHIIPPYKWIELMRAELSAGSSYVSPRGRQRGHLPRQWRSTGRLGSGNPDSDTR